MGQIEKLTSDEMTEPIYVRGVVNRRQNNSLWQVPPTLRSMRYSQIYSISCTPRCDDVTESEEDNCACVCPF